MLITGLRIPAAKIGKDGQPRWAGRLLGDTSLPSARPSQERWRWDRPGPSDSLNGEVSSVRKEVLDSDCFDAPGGSLFATRTEAPSSSGKFMCAYCDPTSLSPIAVSVIALIVGRAARQNRRVGSAPFHRIVWGGSDDERPTLH